MLYESGICLGSSDIHRLMLCEVARGSYLDLSTCCAGPSAATQLRSLPRNTVSRMGIGA
jgi:hypothetical protein